MTLKTFIQKITGRKQKGPGLQWFNYDTGEWDLDTGKMPEDLAPYLPSNPSARNLFYILQEQGTSQVDAYLHVMHLATGTEPVNLEEEE